MSKIICDVCGTSFPETATHCPICGCVRPVDGEVVNGAQAAEDTAKTADYNYVKGGRFSRTNVKRRSNGKDVQRVSNRRTHDEPSEPKEDKDDKGLIVAVCLLLLAIVAVVIYIVVHFFGGQTTVPEQNQGNNQPSTSVSTEATTEATEATTEPDLSCTAIVLSQTSAELEIGGSVQLTATVTPDNTTDALAFASADQNVAKVSDDGKVEAVAAGETTITVTCGNITATCTVVVKAAEATVDPSQATEPTEQPNTGFVAPYRLNKKSGDVSIKVGEAFQLKLLDANDNVIPVTWTVERSSVCSVKENTVKGKAVGTTTVSVEYEGVTYSCVVRVKEAS